MATGQTSIPLQFKFTSWSTHFQSLVLLKQIWIHRVKTYFYKSIYQNIHPTKSKGIGVAYFLESLNSIKIENFSLCSKILESFFNVGNIPHTVRVIYNPPSGDDS